MAYLYKEGFIQTYSNVMRISAGLALAGALMSFLFISDADIKNSYKKIISLLHLSSLPLCG
ncbi:MAG: hypothetical protein ABI266_04825 [Ginsengibacter sp.]